jgi:hypothetical protein
MANTDKNLKVYPYGKEGRHIVHGVDGGAHIYEGTFVSQLTATGMLVPGSTASSGPAVGVSKHEQDNTSGSDGAKRCEFETDRVFLFANGTAGDACSEATMLGSPLFMIDDHTVADNDNSGARQRAGYFMGMEPDGKVRVLVVAATLSGVAPVALTFSAVAGTANDTLEALADPTDTPASADALRDDLVANLLPKVRNNFADLASKVNEIRTALVRAGILV